MLDGDRRRRPLERQHRVARRLGGIDLPRQRQREGAEPGEQVGDVAAPADRLAHRRDQRRLAVRRRLEEGAGAEAAPARPTR